MSKKPRIERNKELYRIGAFALAALMVLGACYSLVYYLILGI